MEFTGLAVEGSREAGGQSITYFAIPAGQESAAARELVACLDDGFEVCLRNDLDESGEGYTLFRKAPTGLVTRVGGHGWSGEWQAIDQAGLQVSIAALAPHNRGGHWSAQGSLTGNQ
jgi:hypothetical protein